MLRTSVHWANRNIEQGTGQRQFEALSNSEALTPGESISENAFFLAMAHWPLDHKQEALQWYKKTLETIEGKIPASDSLARFHDEATKLLEIGTKPSDDKPATPNSK